MSEQHDEVEGLVDRFSEDLDQGVDRSHVLRSAIGRGIDIGVRVATEQMNARFEQLVDRVAHLESVFKDAAQRAVQAEAQRDGILDEMKAAIARIERRMRSGEMPIPRTEQD